MTYCHCILYLANHHPNTYRWNRYALGALFVVYLFVYWVWDTTNSQKNRFRAEETGKQVIRKAFPQLPWQAVKNPRVIRTKDGHSILADGWYGKARKIHYTCDLFFALSWGLITGFSSPFPWFYPAFFAGMISHRALRDIQKCRAKYGDAWLEYEKLVPYLFIPVSNYVVPKLNVILTCCSMSFKHHFITIVFYGEQYKFNIVIIIRSLYIVLYLCSINKYNYNFPFPI
jgi:delta24(24(1))-sterol reductase